MHSPWIVALEALAALGASGGALSLLLKHLTTRRTKQRCQATLNAFTDIAEVYEVLLDLLAEVPGAVRVVILRAENGGGIPNPGKAVYTSVLYEVHQPSCDPIRESWHRQRVDLPYAQMLGELIRLGSVDTVTADLDTGELKTLYRANGVERSYIRALGADESGFLYLSINSATGPAEPSGTLETIRGGVSRIRRLLHPNLCTAVEAPHSPVSALETQGDR